MALRVLSVTDRFADHPNPGMGSLNRRLALALTGGFTGRFTGRLTAITDTV